MIYIIINLGGTIMLLDFTIRNVLSIKNEAFFDLNATSDSSHEHSLIKIGKKRLLPTAAIYGANASGKSNLFKALLSAISFVQFSNSMQINSPIRITPFLFDENSKTSPSEFVFTFINNNIKYSYGFSADSNKVHDEFLYEYKSAKPSLIFERSNTNDYRFTAAKKSEFKQYISKTSNNKLFLSTATAWNCLETRNAFLWFDEGIKIYNQNMIDDQLIPALDSDINSELEAFSTRLLQSADFNISGYTFESQEEDLPNITLPEGVTIDADFLKGFKRINLELLHDVYNNSRLNTYSLAFGEESTGTRRFFSYAPIIFSALKYGKTIMIDEIDSSLHPLLVKNLISVFNNPEINKNGAQLIFNTHNSELLDLDFMRRDQIFFVEKNSGSAASELFSLSDFSPRKTEVIRKGYLQGRYGATPNINLEGMKWF